MVRFFSQCFFSSLTSPVCFQLIQSEPKYALWTLNINVYVFNVITEKEKVCVQLVVLLYEQFELEQYDPRTDSARALIIQKIHDSLSRIWYFYLILGCSSSTQSLTNEQTKWWHTANHSTILFSTTVSVKCSMQKKKKKKTTTSGRILHYASQHAYWLFWPTSSEQETITIFICKCESTSIWQLHDRMTDTTVTD